MQASAKRWPFSSVQNIHSILTFEFRNGATSENTYPEFNRDGKAHSPAFILGVDKVQSGSTQRQTIDNDRDMLEDHLRKIREYTECRR